MEHNNDWEDVFLQAAGGGSSVSFVDAGTGSNTGHINNQNSSVAIATTTNQQRSNKQKRRRTELHSDDHDVNRRNDDDWNHYDDNYFEMLGESFPILPTTTTPVPLVPDCQKYVSIKATVHSIAGSTSSTTSTSSTSTFTTECQHCGQPSGYHQMILPVGVSPATTTTTCSVQQQLFVTIRNFRCYSRIQLFNVTTSTTSTTQLMLAKYQDELRSVVRDYNHNDHNSISRQTKKKYDCLCDITIRNVQRLIQHLSSMKRHIETTTTTMNHGTNRHGIIPHAIHYIQCLMNCDDIYSRLYYNDRTKRDQRQERNLQCHDWSVPYPVTYYQEWCVREDVVHATSTTTEHPLSRIYHDRMAETWSIFSESLLVTMNDNDDAKTRQLWRQCKYDWDLSCRDDLCHLYCYATISNTTLEHMILFLVEHYHCRQIIEMGAGTGYLAHRLQTLGRQCTTNPDMKKDPTGFDVFAYDIANSATAESTNEYHADMAGYYYNVQHGDGRHGQKSKIIYDRHYNNQNTNVALLLCYPPPDHDMGYDAIRNYHTYRPPSSNARTQKIVIYIGEHNKGLTGTRKLDEYLVRHFQCVQRYPCQLYGSVDASEMTIWINRPADVHTSKVSQSILLPCSHCRDKEGIRRCQYLRSLVFCSNSCFQQHVTEQPTSSKKSQQQQQQQTLLWKIIQLDQLDFQNNDHFEPLHRF